MHKNDMKKWKKFIKTNNLKSLEASIDNSLKSSPELYAHVSNIILSHPKYNHIDMYAEL